MAGLQLPAPAWAKAIPEEKLKSALLDRVSTKKESGK